MNGLVKYLFGLWKSVHGFGLKSMQKHVTERAKACDRPNSDGVSSSRSSWMEAPGGGSAPPLASAIGLEVH
ncbi:MAG: hypothetical protein WC241_04070 [Candidatus Paceibacterota bacterium]